MIRRFPVRRIGSMHSIPQVRLFDQLSKVRALEKRPQRLLASPLRSFESRIFVRANGWRLPAANARRRSCSCLLREPTPLACSAQGVRCLGLQWVRPSNPAGSGSKPLKTIQFANGAHLIRYDRADGLGPPFEATTVAGARKRSASIALRTPRPHSSRACTRRPRRSGQRISS